MKKIVFRKAVFSDVSEIVSLCNLCFDETTSTEKAKEIFLKTAADQNQIYLVGEVDGKIVAHTKITIVPTIFEEMNTYAILNHVCVHPDYRRCKYAFKMLEEVKNICINSGCVAMKLWSMNFRVPAHSCYKKFGFHVDDAKFFTYILTKEL